MISWNKWAVKSKFGFWCLGNLFNTASLAYGIYRNGYVEKDESDLLLYLLEQLCLTKNEKLVFYDVGANIGYYGILAVHKGKGKIKAYSFEPVLEDFKVLKENIYLNHYEDSITALNIALSNKNGQAEITLANAGSSLTPGFTFIKNKVLPKTLVNTYELDKFIVDNNIDLPDLIKMDIEGHELPALQGGLQAIKSSLPVLFIEIVHTLLRPGGVYVNKEYKNTLNFLKNLGYLALVQENGHLIKVKNDYIPKIVKMFLFLHQDKHNDLIKKMKIS